MRFSNKALLFGCAWAMTNLPGTPALLPSAQAQGAAQGQAYEIQLPAQPLAAALAALSKQTGIQILAAGEIVTGRQAPAVAGRMTVRDALQRVLAGSGLEAAADPGGTFVVRRAAAPAQGEQQLPEVKVQASAQRENARGPVDGLIAERSATATKTDTPLLETPRALSVVPAEQIRAQAATDIDEALRYTAGVATEYRGMDRSGTDIILRGFEGLIFTDGMRAGTAGYGHLDIDPYGLERIEVLKGPASTLYGAAPPGGVVNLVTKRPVRERFAEIELDVGSYSQLGGKFDLNGALGTDGQFLGRFTGVVRRGDSQVDFEKENRTFLAPSLTWAPGNGTQFTVLGRYQQDEGPWATFLPAVGTVLPNPNGRIRTSFQHGEPNSTDGYEREFRSLGYILEQTFAADWQLRHSLRLDGYDFDGRSTSGWGYDPALNDNRTVLRGPFYGREEGDALTTDTNVQKRFQWGATRHTVLFGLDYRQSSTSAAYGSVNPEPAWNLDVFNPVYGVAVFPSPAQILATGGYVNEKQDLWQTGLYAQDQVRIGRWAFTLGGRYDVAKSTTNDRLAGTSASDKDSAFTGQVGVVHLFDKGFAPYANYAESFEPQAGTDATGKAFMPTTGKHVEVGLKYEPRPGAGLITLSLFETKRQNVLTTDPDDPFFSVQTGEVRVRGWEVEAKVSPLPNLDVLAAYSRIDAKITRSNDGDQGNRPGQTPEVVGSLWATYRFPGGLSVSGGARHTGSTLDYANLIEVPAVTLYDLALRYEPGGAWRGASFMLNARNLTDKTYVASCEGEFWCMYGLRRVVTASVRYRW